jgi:predicted acetyltransferase
MLLMFEHRHQTRLLMTWMLRIVDVPRALEERGYPQSLTERIDFEIEDDVVPENTGRFVLEVEAGRGHVRRGGRGVVRLTARALAPLYSGRASPQDLVAAGQLDANAATIRRLAPVFAGPAPWMADTF